MSDPSRLAEGTAGSDSPTEDLPLPSRQPPPRAQETQPGVAMQPEERGSITRLFGSRLYFRLWLAQFTSSLGDWIGFVAITAISNRIAGTNGVALVLSARLIPGFFLGSVGGLLADRLDRKKVMVTCDIGRGVVIGLLPFVHTLPLLFLINLVLEALTLLWTPAKEATVPNIVREEQLPRVNSLGLAAAYGTFPLGAGLFTALAAVAAYLGRFDAMSALRVNQENLAIWTDTGTYLLSAFLISTLAIPRRDRRPTSGKVDLGQGLRDVREGWSFIRQNAVVRSVMLALSCGLVGGGMVVPLGPNFAKDVLGGGPRAFGALITAMGVGVAIGVIGVSSVQSRLRPERVFVQAVLLAGGCLIAAASTWALTPALLLVAALGVGGGAVYVFGFSLVQSHTEDEMRGRIFSALYASVRLCLVLSFVLGPLLSSLLDRLSRRLLDNGLGIGGWHVALPGSRLALWLAGAIIVGAGLLARRSLRAQGPRLSHPSGTGRRSKSADAGGGSGTGEAQPQREAPAQASSSRDRMAGGAEPQGDQPARPSSGDPSAGGKPQGDQSARPSSSGDRSAGGVEAQGDQSGQPPSDASPRAGSGAGGATADDERTARPAEAAPADRSGDGEPAERSSRSDEAAVDASTAGAAAGLPPTSDVRAPGPPAAGDGRGTAVSPSSGRSGPAR